MLSYMSWVEVDTSHLTIKMYHGPVCATINQIKQLAVMLCNSMSQNSEIFCVICLCLALFNTLSSTLPCNITLLIPKSLSNRINRVS